jgi:organic hydroperoxide reductase OsmC/OhrA
VEIRAAVVNRAGAHEATVSTDGRASRVAIPAKATGAGSSLNGGELLCLALATCYCNDLYREAAARQLPLEAVEVAVVAEFGGRGEPARRITYTAHVTSPASTEAVAALLAETDRVAEVHNTLRQGVAVQFAPAPPAPPAP